MKAKVMGAKWVWRTAALAVVAATIAGCTYTRLAHSPPVYVEYAEPAPYYYDGPFADLSPWGEWIETGAFGWVWRPYVGAGWQPYYHGNWEWTQWGWTWVSYEPFGWAAYHYGFWHYDAIYGWIWLPGDQWFPARVSWMYYGDLVFWAPIPPPGYYIPDPWDVHVDFIWLGVRTDHFMQSDIGRYRIKEARRAWDRVPRSKVRRQSPRTEDIERRTRSKIRPIDVKVKTTRKGGREYERMILPPATKESINRYQKSRAESVNSRSKKQPAQRTSTKATEKKSSAGKATKSKSTPKNERKSKGASTSKKKKK